MLKHNVLTFLPSAEMNCDKIPFWRWGCGDWCFQVFDRKFDFLWVLLPLPYSTCWSMSIPQQLQFSLQYQALPPASSSPLVMRHIPSIFHLIWTLEAELKPQRAHCLSPQKTPPHWQRTFLESCNHFQHDHSWDYVLNKSWLMTDCLPAAISILFSDVLCAVFWFDMRGMQVHDRFCPWSPWLDNSMQRNGENIGY